jgi:hypothetical protein
MTQKDNFSDISALLAHKRSELPADDYFRGVLPEFHRRQRAELLQPRAPWTIWWNHFIESATSFMSIGTLTRYGTVTVVAALLCSLGVIEMQKQSSPATVAESAPRATLYAFNQALDSRYLSKIDQSVDAASVGSVNAGAPLPHYVLADMPAASCDATMAF